jgi:hypothetical protein
MKLDSPRNVLNPQLAAAVGLWATLGCAASVADEALESEPVAHTGQAIIPGSAVTQRSVVLQVPPGSTLLNQQVNCPAGSVVVGGGYLSGGDTRVFASAPNSSGWSVSIQNLSTVSGRSLNLVAQCLSGTNATSAVGAASSGVIAKGSTGCVRAQCPAGKILTAAGYSGPSSFRTSNNMLFNDGSWQICGWNENTANSITVFAYPVCLSGVSGGARQVSTSGPTLAPGASARVDSARCAQGLLLASAGALIDVRDVYTYGTTRSFQDPTRWSNHYINLSSSFRGTNVAATCLELWQ